MADIFDYLDFRSDLSFQVSPFNEVDNYIICKIGSYDFSGIVGEGPEPVPIKEALEKYYERYGEKGDYLGLLAARTVADVVKRLPETERFRDLRLSGYVSILDNEDTEQFSALTVTLPDGTNYVSFRGTDDTLLAWKENFLMSVEKEIPAQRDALNYLKRAAETYEGPLIVGGHSKGGNMSVFASSFAPEEVQDRIKAVYSNDGPGFYPEFIKEPGYLRIRPKLHVILPTTSIVGTLLTQDEGIEIVECDRLGVSSHDGFRWHVKGTSFVRSEKLSRSSEAYENGMQAVLNEMSIEERRAFLDEFFEAFAQTGAVTLTDLNEHRIRQAARLLRSFSRSSEAKRFALAVTEQMLRELMPDNPVIPVALGAAEKAAGAAEWAGKAAGWAAGKAAEAAEKAAGWASEKAADFAAARAEGEPGFGRVVRASGPRIVKRGRRAEKKGGEAPQGAEAPILKKS
ncbi:MAG: DUF2974 domain-containing protein [Firmicutes bacterium]|nr:DUF2974 domain-containing protein [Bacillota bacterium]